MNPSNRGADFTQRDKSDCFFFEHGVMYLLKILVETQKLTTMKAIFRAHNQMILNNYA